MSVSDVEITVDAEGRLLTRVTTDRAGPTLCYNRAVFNYLEPEGCVGGLLALRTLGYEVPDSEIQRIKAMQ